MTHSVRDRFNPFIAAAAGSVVACSLVVAAPQAGGLASVKDAVVAVQLQATATTVVAALVNTEGATPPSVVADAAVTDVPPPIDQPEATETTEPPMTEAPTLPGALIETVVSFVTMAVLAPINIVLSPLLLLLPLIDVGECRYLACVVGGYLFAGLIQLVTIGPALGFINSLQNLWATLFPPATPASQAASTPQAASAVDVLDPAPSAVADGSADSAAVPSAPTERPTAERRGRAVRAQTPGEPTPSPANAAAATEDPRDTAIPEEEVSPSTPQHDALAVAPRSAKKNTLQGARSLSRNEPGEGSDTGTTMPSRTAVALR